MPSKWAIAEGVAAVEAGAGRVLPQAWIDQIVLTGLPRGGDIVQWIEDHGAAAKRNGLCAEMVRLEHAGQP